MMKALWEAMPDGKIEVEAQWTAKGVVFSEGTLRGTQTGGFKIPQGEIPASGNHATVKRFEDGKLVSEHLYFDQLEFLQQSRLDDLGDVRRRPTRSSPLSAISGSRESSRRSRRAATEGSKRGG